MATDESRWPPELAALRADGATVVSEEHVRDEQASRDSLGTPGTVETSRVRVVVQAQRPRDDLRRRLEEAGLRIQGPDGERTEFASPPADGEPARSDPFVLERSLRAFVRGRALSDAQRAVIERKVATLRREIEDPATEASRRAAAAPMLRSLEDGLATWVEFLAVTRRFRPQVELPDPRESIGAVLPLSVGSRLTYRVRPLADDGAAVEDGEGGPMVLHVVALGERQAALLYAGGLHGFRRITDLAEGRCHDAWFHHRERSRTDATAPWIGRCVLEELVQRGSSALVVDRRRDAEPIPVYRTEEARATVEVDGARLEVPVRRCRTAREDVLEVLLDVGNPLVLRLEERGADLLRTIDAIDRRPRS